MISNHLVRQLGGSINRARNKPELTQDLPDKGYLYRVPAISLNNVAFVALLAALCTVTYGCPTILTKSQWGGRAPTCRTAMATPVTYVVIHHTEGASCSTQATCITQAKSVQNYHINSNGWCDIGYSFLVGEDGSIFEGRGWTSVGAHAPNYNSNSIGISIIGSFTSRNPSTAAQNAAKNLIACGVTKGYIKSAYILKGHRNVTATDCPGNTFYNTVKTWPRFQA